MSWVSGLVETFFIDDPIAKIRLSLVPCPLSLTDCQASYIMMKHGHSNYSILGFPWCITYRLLVIVNPVGLVVVEAAALV